MHLNRKELLEVKAAIEEAALECGYFLEDTEGEHSLETFELDHPERADLYLKVCREIRGAVEADIVGHI
jgi:hypothetical protein